MFEGLLTHTAIIEIKTVTEDTAGQPVESWATSIANVKCRLDAAGGSGVVDAPEYVYGIATHILFLRYPGVDLNTTSYRINISSIIYEILLVSVVYDATSVHHIELLLRIVT